MIWYRFLLLCVASLRAVQCAGVLRLRILNLQNLEGRTINGKCCEKDDRSLLGVCRGSCHTFLRLCATTVGRHTQVDHSYSRNARQPLSASSWRLLAVNGTEISDNSTFAGSPPELVKEGPGAANGTQSTSEFTRSRAAPTPACTIGSVITPPIFNNSLDPTVEGILDVAFPFNSSWSGKFMFIIEGWNVRNGLFNATQSLTQKGEFKEIPVLVARFKRIHYPTQIGKWSAAFAFSPHVKVDYAFRLDCEDSFGGPNCSQKTDDTTSRSRTTGLSQGNFSVGEWIMRKRKQLRGWDTELSRTFFLSGLGDAIGVTVDTLYALNTSIYYATVIFKVLKYGVLFLNFFG